MCPGASVWYHQVRPVNAFLAMLNSSMTRRDWLESATVGPSSDAMRRVPSGVIAMASKPRLFGCVAAPEPRRGLFGDLKSPRILAASNLPGTGYGASSSTPVLSK